MQMTTLFLNRASGNLSRPTTRFKRKNNFELYKLKRSMLQLLLSVGLTSRFKLFYHVHNYNSFCQVLNSVHPKLFICTAIFRYIFQ